MPDAGSPSDARHAHETTPLLFKQASLEANPAAHAPEDEQSPASKDNPSVLSTIAVLLIGVFVSQADVFLVLTCYGRITSEFNALHDGDWLMTSYLLAQSVAQPLYGKLSDIFGRKRCLQMSYVLFSLGTLCSSLAQSMPQITASRALEGVGGAGMVCMVSILLTDLVPLHKVAIWRSYTNVVQTMGRSCGAVIGGYIAQTIGWRWAFAIQCPLVLIGLLLTELKLQTPSSHGIKGEAEDIQTWHKLRRIDWFGVILLSITILSALGLLSVGGTKLPWSDWRVLTGMAVAVMAGTAFALVEKYHAVDPIFAVHLMTHPAVLTAYTTLAMQNIAVTGMTFITPQYFQILDGASPGQAGAYLLFAPIGNGLGGLATGWWIGRTRGYKLPSIVGGILSVASFLAMAVVWQGTTGWLAASLIFPIGLATGIAHSASFIRLSVGVEAGDIAVAGSGHYLFNNVGMMAGVSLVNTVYQRALAQELPKALQGFPQRDEIIDRVTSDIEYVQHLPRKIFNALVPAYIATFQQVFVLGIAVSTVVLLASVFSKSKKVPTS